MTAVCYAFVIRGTDYLPRVRFFRKRDEDHRCDEERFRRRVLTRNCVRAETRRDFNDNFLFSCYVTRDARKTGDELANDTSPSISAFSGAASLCGKYTRAQVVLLESQSRRVVLKNRRKFTRCFELRLGKRVSHC